MTKQAEKINVTETISAVYGCKWSLKIFKAIRSGINRPGAMEKSLPGLTKRVQSYYFKRMMELGVLEKHSFPEIPPRVEYSITPYGEEILTILLDIVALEEKLKNQHLENRPK